MKNSKNIISRLFLFSEPERTEEFVLTDNKNDSENVRFQQQSKKRVRYVKRKNEHLLLNKNGYTIKKGTTNDRTQKQQEASDNTGKKISKKLSDNLQYMKDKYSIPVNGDIIIREFDISVREQSIQAFIIFYDGMTDRTVINESILQPLMLLSNLDIKSNKTDITQYISKHLIPQNQIKITKEYSVVIDEINFGGCGLFIDGIEHAFAADVKGWEHRRIERPNTESVIRGPQEGFNEVLRSNTALLRKILKDEDLIAEDICIGRRSKTPCSMMYIKDIANDSLINEVRRRLSSIKIDYLIDSGQLEQLIEDNTYTLVPQVLATERPDRVASMLSEGHVAVVMHGSPFVLVMPVTFAELIHSSEDAYMRFPFTSLLRFMRILSILLSLLLPALYIAITNFHHEIVPEALLLVIEATRGKVPFPTVVDILIMEVSFELIREAGIRIPSPIGPTLGIVGALMLGQAAVAANIVSPLLIIIVAVTGISSFATPNFSLGFTIRALRFVYIILASMAGLLGINTGIFIHILLLVNAKSFGVPVLTPFAPITSRAFTNAITRTPEWNQEKRPDFLNAKDSEMQPDISRGWKKGGGKSDK